MVELVGSNVFRSEVMSSKDEKGCFVVRVSVFLFGSVVACLVEVLVVEESCVDVACLDDVVSVAASVISVAASVISVAASVVLREV